jgi:hypothetical protein
MYATTCRTLRVTVGSNNNGETTKVGKEEDDDEDEENEGIEKKHDSRKLVS